MSSPLEPDRDAIEACRRRDAEGLRRLYERYRTRVFRSCLRILGNTAAAEDATQEVFLKLYGKIASFNGNARFSTWLYRLTVNHSLDLLERRRRSTATVELGEAEAVQADRGDRPDRRLHARERSASLARALARLADDHRVILVLREIEGLSYRDLGEVLDLPPGTVMSRLARARRELRRQWSDEEQRR